MESRFDAEARDRMQQELLELHFGCHPDPAALERRLAAEPALRALQAETLRTAALLEAAVRPDAPPLVLAAAPARPWWRQPWRRLGAVAAAAALCVAALAAC